MLNKWFTLLLIQQLIVVNPALSETKSQKDVSKCDKALNACLTLSTEQDKDIKALKLATKQLEDKLGEDKSSVLPAYMWVLVGGYLGITATILLKR